MAWFEQIVSRLSGLVWGWPMLILLLGTGLYLTILLRGMQFWALPHALKLIFSKDRHSQGDISHFAALMTALAATVGNGNIVGVAGAIALGGPGAVFWMWVTGLVGMATKYAEAVLAIRFREQGPYGMRGGPMYYISRGVGLPWLGWLFAFFASFAAFGIGNMFQGQAVASNFAQTFNIHPQVTGIVLTVLTGLVLLGGIRWIGRFTSFLVPVMILGYCGAGFIALILHWDRIPQTFGLIFKYAFTPYAATGGVFGALLGQTIRHGVARGIFSNESGLGSAPIMAAAARTKDPSTQALVSMTQTFIDTLVVCTMTGLVILNSGLWESGTVDKGVLTGASFAVTLGGIGPIIVALASAVFAYSTLIGWSYLGEKAVEYLLGSRAVIFYRIIFVVMVYVGCTQVNLGLVLNLSDLMNGLMAIPNLVGLLVLSKIVRQETLLYFGSRKASQ